jgi:glucose/arabinose dehydrogenase
VGRTLAAVVFVFAVAAGMPSAPSTSTARLDRAAGIAVPAGFRAEVYARGLHRPTAMAFSPAGRLYVTQEGGTVVRVAPGSSRPLEVARGFRTPLGLTFVGRALFVSAQGTLWRLEGGRRRAVVSRLPFGLHQQDNVVFHTGRLFFGSGSTCNACRERSRLSAAVLSVRPDGRELRVVARGLRNPYGLALQPGTGRLFASVNGRDDLGDREPAEAVVEIRPGRSFGWPACWPSAAHLRLAGRCKGVTPPAAYLEPHSSADGLVFYAGRSFPASYRGNLFVAEWGTYFGHAHGRRVVRVVLDRRGHGARARVTAFASGFSHPLAVAVDARGAVLVGDYGRGIVYRIQAAGRP